MILPHDRVGSDFSWLQGPSQKEQKEKKFEAEDSFSYRKEESRSSEIFSCREKRGRKNVEAQAERVRSASGVASDLLDSSGCEKIKRILKCLDSADTAKAQALETLSRGGSGLALASYWLCVRSACVDPLWSSGCRRERSTGVF